MFAKLVLKLFQMMERVFEPASAKIFTGILQWVQEGVDRFSRQTRVLNRRGQFLHRICHGDNTDCERVCGALFSITHYQADRMCSKTQKVRGNRAGTED